MRRNSPLSIGITGGIGAGKSMVAKVFNTLGAPVYDADIHAKWLMNNDPRLKKKIESLIGPDAYLHGTLNRKHIASVAFKNEHLLDQLNQFVHPAVGKDFELWAVKQNTEYVLKEAALLFEAGSYQSLDLIITVTASENTRIKRVISRDGRSEKEVKDIISRQWPEAKKVSLSDYVINNDGHEMVIPQVLRIHEQVLNQVGR